MLKKIGYLGPRGTFTEAAARKYSGDDPVELVCFMSLPGIVSAVDRGEVDEGVVPLENSTEGGVSQILDMVAQTGGVKFRGEVILSVRHNLLVRPGMEKSRVERVLSHPQALAQCREYLNRELPWAVQEETGSTTQAADLVACSDLPWAAIGTELAAGCYGLEIAGHDIQDSNENATRFVVLGKTDAPFSGDCRTSLVVIARDRPGALYGILREFALRDINLTRIESRPAKKKLGQYMFFIDLEGHREEERVSRAIEVIGERAAHLRVLGSYPRDRSAMCEQDGDGARNPVTLEEARSEIDMVDLQIVELIGIRTRLVEKVGALKGHPGRVRDVAREEEVIRRVRGIAERKGADPDMVERVYRLMIPSYVEMQRARLKNR
ncbi:MAG: prephenate dehydratase [Bacillota bacterium]